jgi:DNA-binding NtrC family response regulator
MVQKNILNGKKVLIVDDEPDVLDTLGETLSMCDVSKASSFEEAKRLFEKQHFDIAILDIMGVRGYTLLEIAEERITPAIMLTAHALNLESTVRSFKAGAAYYVPKDEISKIAVFMTDVLEAKKRGKKPWHSWLKRMTGYYDKKFGDGWERKDKEFWEKFRYYSSGL